MATVETKLKWVLVVVIIVVYANTIGHAFAWDDSIVITENKRVQAGISGIPDLFLKYNSNYKADQYGYRPIVLSTFAIEYSLFNKSAHAMHLMNVLYFVVLCLVIFNVLKKIISSCSILIAFLITLLFAVHPLHTEVVANIKSRDDIFAMLFSFLALNAFINYYTVNKTKHLIYALAFLMVAFLSKESAIVFIFILPLTLFYKSNWTGVKAILNYAWSLVPLFFIFLIIVKLYTGSTLGVQSSKGLGIYYEAGILGNSFAYTDLFMSKVANCLSILFLYFKNFVAPYKLVYFYGYNQVPVAQWSDATVLFSLLFHLSLLLFAIFRRKTDREISYGILFYFISIFFYTQLAFKLADTMADRFMFVPSLGLCIVAVFSMGKLLNVNFQTLTISGRFRSEKSSKTNERNFGYFFGVVIVVFAIATFNRNKVWKDNETLITHDMPYLENCARAHNYYADILKIKLSTAYSPSIETEMISHYKRSIQISNESYYSYLSLGTYYCNAKRYSEGISVLLEMVKKFPEQADPNFYLGQAYFNVENYPLAFLYLQKSLKLAPEVTNTYFYLALTLSRQLEYAKALAVVNTMKQKFGESFYVCEALGAIYYDKGDLEQSTHYTFETLKYGVAPESVYGKVIGRYQTKKLNEQAAFFYRQALEKGVFKKQ